MKDLCPTCGSPVTVTSDDDGTSYYEPCYARAAVLEAAIREHLRREYESEPEDVEEVWRDDHPAVALARVLAVTRTSREETP